MPRRHYCHSAAAAGAAAGRSRSTAAEEAAAEEAAAVAVQAPATAAAAAAAAAGGSTLAVWYSAYVRATVLVLLPEDEPPDRDASIVTAGTPAIVTAGNVSMERHGGERKGKKGRDSPLLLELNRSLHRRSNCKRLAARRRRRRESDADRSPAWPCGPCPAAPQGKASVFGSNGSRSAGKGSVVSERTLMNSCISM